MPSNPSPKREKTRRKKEDDAIFLMYNALMAIGCIDTHFNSPNWCFHRAQEIANLAIRDMNVKHTKAVQFALGLVPR